MTRLTVLLPLCGAVVEGHRTVSSRHGRTVKDGGPLVLVSALRRRPLRDR